MDAVTIENLTKTYNGTCVLKGITLTIPQGEFYCLMGPNGSGKTTLVSIIASVRSPTQGTLKIFGKSPDQAKPLIGYVPQENFSSPSLTGKENLVYFARILGYPKSEAEPLADVSCRRLDSQPKLKKGSPTTQVGCENALKLPQPYSRVLTCSFWMNPPLG
jgi:ABC-2 type transport system ATP-binding protein